MLERIRAGIAILSLVLLAVGYAASQIAYPDRIVAYTEWIDRPAVSRAALVLVLAIVVLAFIPTKEGAE
jgi:hypothetical protein